MIALDPNATFEFPRPPRGSNGGGRNGGVVFVSRHLTALQMMAADRLTDEASGKTAMQAIPILLKALATGVVSAKLSDITPRQLTADEQAILKELQAKHPDIPQYLWALVPCLTSDELWDAALAMMNGSRLSEIERKKSALQSASAAAANASAPT